MTQPTTFLEGGGSAGPGSKDRPETGMVVQPAAPSHGNIIPFSPQGEVPPDNGRVPPGSGGGLPPETPPEDDDCACNSSGQLKGNESGSTGGYDTGREFSEGPVRYFDGTVKYMATDIESSGFGPEWGVTRTWTNGSWTGSINGNTNGSGITVPQQPFLMSSDLNHTQVVMVVNGWDYHYFQSINGLYKVLFFDGEYLTYDSGNHDYLYVDSRGDQMTFYDFNTTLQKEQGKLKGYKDSAGNDTHFTYDSSGLLMTVGRSISISGSTAYEQFAYSPRRSFPTTLSPRSQMEFGNEKGENEIKSDAVSEITPAAPPPPAPAHRSAGSPAPGSGTSAGCGQNRAGAEWSRAGHGRGPDPRPR